jgi:hypothetical protein
MLVATLQILDKSVTDVALPHMQGQDWRPRERTPSPI